MDLRFPLENTTTMKNLLIVMLLFVAICTQAQDIHFSHIHASPTAMNPAMTGLFEGDLRLIGNYRSQWNNFTNGYKTVAGSVDTKLFPLSRTDFIGAGLQLYKDVAGDLEFTTSYGALSISVLKALDARGTNFISFGMQGALMSNSVNYNNIVAFDNEPLIQGGAPDRIRYADFIAGLGWFYAIDRYNSDTWWSRNLYQRS